MSRPSYATFACSARIAYIIEEYLRTDGTPLEYAWWCETLEEAEKIVLEQIRMHGHERLYSMFIHIQE